MDLKTTLRGTLAPRGRSPRADPEEGSEWRTLSDPEGEVSRGASHHSRPLIGPLPLGRTRLTQGTAPSGDGPSGTGGSWGSSFAIVSTAEKIPHPQVVIIVDEKSFKLRSHLSGYRVVLGSIAMIFTGVVLQRHPILSSEAYVGKNLGFFRPKNAANKRD